MAKQEVIFDKVGVVLYGKGTKEGPLTADKAKELLGWVSEKEAKKTLGDKEGDFGKDFLFRDFNGDKVRCTNNPTNRPFRKTLAKRYSNEILRQKWTLNGESFVIDKRGNIQDGQHRLIGLVLAEQIRKSDPEPWKEYGTKSPLSLECIVVTGIDDRPETVDTLNLGQKRSLGDVLFRNHEFDLKTDEFSESNKKKLSTILAGAARLVWLRAGGQSVSDAPHFPHSEALDFLETHPRLTEAVLFIWREEGGTGADGKLISTHLSLSYAAALMYLLGTAATDGNQYAETGELNYDLWEKAEEFWPNFHSATEFQPLRNALHKIDSSGGMGRDEIVGTMIKGINLWLDGKEIKGSSVKMKRKTKDGKPYLAETPRLGGLDAEVEVIDAEPKDTPADNKPPKGSKTKGGWAEGDTAWVRDVDEQHWFGKILEVYKGPNGEKVARLEADEGGEYEAPISALTVNQPK